MLKFSKKPLMIAGGCSFTDANFTSLFHDDLDTSWDKWPAIFGKKHEFEVLNVGKSGSGNAHICQSVINAVNENPSTELVLVLWSGWDRIRVYRTNFCPIGVLSKKAKINEESEKNILDKYPHYKSVYDVSKIMIDNYLDINAILNQNMFHMWILKDFLEKRNIKYIFAQGVAPLELTFFDEEYIEKTIRKELYNFLNHIYYDDLDIENFYGWPLFKALGGNHLDKFTKKGSQFRISELDAHPNAKGHEEFAKIFSKAYKKVYA